VPVIANIFDSVLTVLEAVPALRVGIAVISMFFLPGFLWTLVIIKKSQINYLERIALSIGLSIALVTLSFLAMNLVLGVRFSGPNGAMAIFIITFIPLVWYGIRKLVERRKSRTP
jgi:uncharacterized membrane protein